MPNRTKRNRLLWTVSSTASPNVLNGFGSAAADHTKKAKSRAMRSRNFTRSHNGSFLRAWGVGAAPLPWAPGAGRPEGGTGPSGGWPPSPGGRPPLPGGTPPPPLPPLPGGATGGPGGRPTSTGGGGGGGAPTGGPVGRTGGWFGSAMSASPLLPVSSGHHCDEWLSSIVHDSTISAMSSLFVSK